MIRNTDFIVNLVKALDGDVPELRTIEADALVCQQYLILDIVMWMIHQGTAENRYGF